jgi:Cu/Ag efflux pump CusA
VVGVFLFLAAALSAFITAAIVYILVYDSVLFFQEVSIIDFLTDTEWTPVFEKPRFGIITLVSGTLMTTLIGLVPMIVQKPSLGDVSYYSMALVILGGLTISTFLTAVLLPTTATLVEDGVGVASRWMETLLRRRARGIVERSSAEPVSGRQGP